MLHRGHCAGLWVSTGWSRCARRVAEPHFHNSWLYLFSLPFLPLISTCVFFSFLLGPCVEKNSLFSIKCYLSLLLVTSGALRCISSWKRFTLEMMMSDWFSSSSLKTTAIQSSKQAHLAHVSWPGLPHSKLQMCSSIKARAALPPCRELGPKYSVMLV